MVPTSAMLILPALATAGLKLRAEPLEQGTQEATSCSASCQARPSP